MRVLVATFQQLLAVGVSLSSVEAASATQLLTEVEGTLIPQIVDKLVTDIFQASASNW